MTSQTTPLAGRALVAAAALLVAVSAILCVTHGQAQRRTRPGIRLQFATIGTESGGGGLDGSAFLIVSRRHVQFDAVPRQCSGGHVVEVTATHHRAHVRSVRMLLHLRGTGTVPIRGPSGRGCPAAELSAEIESVGQVDGGTGEVTVSEANLSEGGQVRGTFSWTVIQQGHPYPMRGEFTIPL